MIMRAGGWNLVWFEHFKTLAFSNGCLDGQKTGYWPAKALTAGSGRYAEGA